MQNFVFFTWLLKHLMFKNFTVNTLLVVDHSSSAQIHGFYCINIDIKLILSTLHLYSMFQCIITHILVITSQGKQNHLGIIADRYKWYHELVNNYEIKLFSHSPLASLLYSAVDVISTTVGLPWPQRSMVLRQTPFFWKLDLNAINVSKCSSTCLTEIHAVGCYWK